MTILDIFKKKKEKKEKITKPVEETKTKKEVKPIEKPKEEILFEKPSARVKKSAEVRPPQVKREVRAGEAWRILKSPHITEKATDLTKKNQYVFKVFPRANKVEIKKAVRNLYGVDVVSVKVINILPKKRRLGRISGWKSGYRKAIVRIKEGQKIEVLPR